jgi:hypothetical protein
MTDTRDPVLLYIGGLRRSIRSIVSGGRREPSVETELNREGGKRGKRRKSNVLYNIEDSQHFIHTGQCESEISSKNKQPPSPFLYVTLGKLTISSLRRKG